MIIVGIDPGKSGAIFVYDTDLGLHDCAGIPLVKIKGKEKPDYPAMCARWLALIAQADHVFIERVGAMPGQGVTSMFSFGYVAGAAYGLVLAAAKPHSFVTPQSWKKIVGLAGSDGEQSRQRASQLLPACATFWPRKKDDGKAEAALIAYAGFKILNGVTNGKAVGRGPDLSPASRKGKDPDGGGERTRDQREKPQAKHR